MPDEAPTPLPRADRPDLPAGYLEHRPLPWSWARARLERARSYWICSVTPAGRPHARPVWGVWLDEAFYFSTGSRLILRNLAASAHVSVNLESGDETVVIEGIAESVHDRSLIGRVLAAYNPKYAWDMKPEQGGFWVVGPRLAFGWLCDGSGEDGGALYSATVTRWRF